MKILIICPNELFYEPRLRKSAIFFSNQGHEVHVMCALTSEWSNNIHNKIKAGNPSIIFHETDISKQNVLSYFKWLFSSIIHLLAMLTLKYTGINLLYKRGILNKTLILAKYPKINFDIIYCNLIDTLPLSFYIKNRKCPKAKIIYDSQEFFTGQYSDYPKHISKWVNETESNLINKIDFVIGTTNAMVNALSVKYNLKENIFRLRNMPLQKELPFLTTQVKNTNLKMIWHGKSINLNNKRGVHILVKAALLSKSYCELYLQGVINESELEKLEKIKEEYPSSNNVFILPPAQPDKIVESLVNYDIGLIGELPEELNQEYTSSNKLFDFIGAGLAIIAPDVMGLRETIDEYKNGLIYKPGDFKTLSSLIEVLDKNRDMLQQLKEKSIIAREKYCYWENDFSLFYDNL